MTADPGDLAFGRVVESSIAGEDGVPASSLGLTVEEVRLRWTGATNGDVQMIEVSVDVIPPGSHR